MHTLHKAVEVGAGLLLERQRVEEGIDQVGLAAAHAAPEIQALDRVLGLLAEQRTQQAGLALVRCHQIVIQALQMAHRSFLGGVMEEVGPFQVLLVSR